MENLASRYFEHFDKLIVIVTFLDADNKSSPKSHRSRRSFAFSTTKRKVHLVPEKAKFEPHDKALKIQVEERVVPYDEQRLRDRKEKQIQHQKWEAAQKKIEEERERKNKLKNKFVTAHGKNGIKLFLSNRFYF